MNESVNFWQSSLFGKAASVLAIVLVLFVGMKVVNEFKQSSYIGRDVPLQNVISVSGDGETFAKPDTATFNFTIEEDAAIVADAQKEVDTKIKKVIDLLKKEGVAEKDIKTVGYYIYPKYEYAASVICSQYGCPPQGEPKIIGYKVSQTIEVKARDIEKAGNLLSVVGEVGVMNLSGLNFTVDDEDALKSEARQMAIEKAKAKAEELADQLGVRLVRIMNFSESGSYPPMYYAKDVYGMGGAVEQASNSVTVSPGETKVTSNVTITYEIR